MATRSLTQERLKYLLNYDPETGVFTWNVNRTAGVKAGDIAGSTGPEGYRIINVYGQAYRGHRVAWFYMTGEWPPQVIDHINKNPSDNRFENLRLASIAQNGMNRKRDIRNASGVTGVTWCKTSRKWRADIGENGKILRLGRFQTLEEAVAARKAAELRHSANAYIQR